MQDNSCATVAREHGTTRILYVEDDARLRRAFAHTLLSRGIGVDTASNRHEALSLAEQHAYPVIVTDLLLPETDGVTLANELRCVQPDASFIITTGFEVELRALGGLDDSIACYLKKPWRENELTEAVENARESYRIRRSTRAPAQAPRYTVLMVEPDPAEAYQLTLQLQNAGIAGEPAHARDLAGCRQVLERAQFDVVIASLELPDESGVAAVQQLRVAAPDAALIMLYAAHSGTTRSAALCSGAQDYLPREQLDPEQLRRAIQGAVERMRNNQRRQRSSNTQDPLTRLPNRKAFCTKLDLVVAQSRRADRHCAVMLLSLDGLKQIEQAHGNDAVEEVLCEMGRRVQASVREEDTVGRMSEAEFGILVEDVEDVQVCERVARRLLSIAAVPVLLRDELDVYLKLSVGIAVCPDSAATAEQLLQAASDAMGTAKANESGFHLQPPTEPPTGSGKRRTT